MRALFDNVFLGYIQTAADDEEAKDLMDGSSGGLIRIDTCDQTVAECLTKKKI